jgi:hypothetical protein
LFVADKQGQKRMSLEPTQRDATHRPRRFLTRRAQADRYGKNIRTIVRWGEDPDMNMPDEYWFNGLPHRAEDELETWERSRISSTAA